MSQRPSPRPGASRFALVAAPVVLALLLTLALAWSSWAARAAHRRSSERTVQDYAQFAATLVATNAESLMGQTLLYAFYAVDLAERAGTAGPVHPAELAANPPEAGRCAARYPEGRWFARLGAHEEEMEVVGPIPAATAAWLTGALREVLRGPGTARSGNLFPALSPQREVVAWRVRRDAAGRALEVHALAHCFEVLDPTDQAFQSAFAQARERSALLPPGLVGTPHADSLLALLVTGPNGEEVYRSPVDWRSPFQGGFRATSGPLHGLDVTVVLRPDLSQRLVAGGLPPSRLPATVGLVLLTGGLLAATLVQVGRSLELARLRERFVADVSHELRTPLQQILIFVQLLRLGRLRNEEERAESLGIVERETHRLIRLVERLLAFSRPGAGSDQPPGDARAVLGASMTEAVQAFRPVAEAGGASLELDPGDEALEVALAPGPLRQVLVNLLDNALKYGPPGQRVRIAAERAGGVARLTVDDQGPGIPPGERERAWRPFYRLEREAENATSGSGIGLAIVREIVEAAGGRATLGDAPGGGARVMLELPLATAGHRATPLVAP